MVCAVLVQMLDNNMLVWLSAECVFVIQTEGTGRCKNECVPGTAYGRGTKRARVHSWLKTDYLHISRAPCSRETTRTPHACITLVRNRSAVEKEQCCMFLKLDMKANKPLLLGLYTFFDQLGQLLPVVVHFFRPSTFRFLGLF